ncbi:DNA-binding transcriptional MerR regulator [Micromonospora jinlongensis]|uniref:DNA-binding transcriptional MerR regulator n=1 Tax=Micromonospora jinlongensis TaxID=1287877 RepID=A0A7Y9WVW6_9ACTN|nr:MerR family transcriptional regulator [Micromonospora jinlongensis]NYH40429.1 DNA-binding transcriptional MerR regulator [Micromonospora jinlongensis]
MATVDAVADGGLSIGQVAQRTGLSVHTLRLYERAGLLAGDVRRDGSGRRVYSAWDVEWLAHCVKFRASGMPLTTISRLAQLVREGIGNEAERLDLLREHRRHITEQLARLRDCLELVDVKVASYEQHLTAGGSGDPWQQQHPVDRAGPHGSPTVADGKPSGTRRG